MKKRLLLIPILMLILLFSSCGKCEMCFYYVEEVIKAPTCTEDGYGKHKCSVCGDEYEGPIASYGHSFSETIIKVATCSEEGIKDKLCTVCNYKTQENYILEHSFELTSKVEATCETQGNEVKTCKNCNYVDTKIIDALGHKYEAYYATDPTCLEEGHKDGKQCSTCKKYSDDVVVLDKVDHKYENGKCRWCESVQSFTVTYVYSDEKIEELTINYGDKFNDLEVESTKEKTFLGWFDDISNKYDNNFVIKDNLTVYAKFSENVLISTKEDFLNIKNYPNKTYVIVNDIDMEGAYLSSIETFTGVLNGLSEDGKRYTVKNFTLSFDGEIIDFGFIVNNKGTIKNIIFKDYIFSSKITVPKTGGSIGGLVGINNGTIENVTMDSINFAPSVTNNNNSVEYTLSPFVGKNANKMINCDITATSNVDLKVYTPDGFSGRKCYANIGALAGNNTGTISNSSSNYKIAISTSLHYSGGVYYDYLDIRVGSAVGKNSGKVNESHAFLDLTTKNVQNRHSREINRIGGFVGMNEASANISSCISSGKIKGNAGYESNIGGFVGFNTNTACVIASYSSVELITNTKCETLYVGGFVGHNTATVQDSYSVNTITSNIKATVGGFAGLNAKGGIISKTYTTSNMDVTSGTVNKHTAINEGTITKSYCANNNVYNTGSATTGSLNLSTEISEVDINNFVSEKFIKENLSWNDKWVINGYEYPILTWEVESKLHNFIEGEIEPTCTEEGCKYLYCNHCDRYIIKEVIEALGHTKVSETPIKKVDATHTENGYEIYECKATHEDGNNKFTVVLEALGHKVPETLSCEDNNVFYDEELESYYYLCDCDLNNETEALKIYVSKEEVNHKVVEQPRIDPSCGELLSALNVAIEIVNITESNDLLSESENTKTSILVEELVKDPEFNNGEKYVLSITNGLNTYNNYIIMNNGLALFELYDSEYNLYTGQFTYSIVDNLIIVNEITIDNIDGNITMTIDKYNTNILIGTYDGIKAGTKCDICEQILSGCEIIPAHYYKFKETLIPAKCNEIGIDIEECQLCNHLKEVEIDMIPHEFANGSISCKNCKEERYKIDNDYVEISTVGDLKNIEKNPSGKYYLTNSIDMMDVDISTILDFEFNGIFHGNGKKLYNLSYNYANKNKVNSGLFDKVGKNGVIIGLTISDVTVNVTNVNEAIIGIITGENNGIITNCTITCSEENSNKVNFTTNVSSSDLKSKDENFDYTFGFISAINNGNIDYCNVTSYISINNNLSAYYNANFNGLTNLGKTGAVKNNTTITYGSITGKNNGKISSSIVNADIIRNAVYESNVDGTGFGQAYINVDLYEAAFVGVNNGDIIDSSSIKMASKNIHDKISDGYENSFGLDSHLEALRIKDYTVYEMYQNLVGYSSANSFASISIITK